MTSVIQQNQTSELEMNGKEEESFHRSMDEWEESFDNFYVDYDFGYTMGSTIKKWNTKRQQWLRAHPHIKNYTEGGRPHIFLLRGSQPCPCKNQIGDHLLLRSFKNNQDYYRIHGLDMFYNTILLHRRMFSFKAKMQPLWLALKLNGYGGWTKML